MRTPFLAKCESDSLKAAAGPEGLKSCIYKIRVELLFRGEPWEGVMDEFKLPVVAVDTRLTDALQTMQTQHVSGVYVRHSSSPKIIDADLISYHLNLNSVKVGTVGNLNIGTIQPRMMTVMLPHDLAHPLDTLSPAKRLMVEEFLDNASASFGSAVLVREHATILSRYESFADNLRNTTTIGWRCTGPEEHTGTDFNALPGGTHCPECGYIVTFGAV